MRRELTPEDFLFRQQVEQFFDDHCPPGDGHRIWQDVNWLDALTERGWLAPGWPSELGGSSFSETEKFIWYQACHKHIPGFTEPAGLATVAPLLARLATATVRARYLPRILDCSARWCLALQPDELPKAYRRNDRWSLQGVAKWVSDAPGCHFLLGLAEFCGTDDAATCGLYICDFSTPDITLVSVPTLTGSEVYHIEFDHVVLPDEDLVCFLDDVSVLNLPSFQLGRSAVAALQLQQLDEVLQGLSPDEDLAYHRNTAAVEVAALQAMEARYLDALQRAERVPFPLAALAVRAAAVELKVGSLLMDSFGYYALPYPDLWLQHNEGELGPPGARAATTAWLQRTVSENYASVSQDLYGKLVQEQQDTGEQ